MSEKIIEIRTPQLGANEDRATLVVWYKSDKEKIKKGEKICALETAKATFDVESEFSGFIAHFANIGQEISTSETLALIFKDREELEKGREEYLTNIKRSTNAVEGDGVLKATKKAEKLALKLGLDINELELDGIIRERDIKDFADRLGLEAEEDNTGGQNIERTMDLTGNRKIGKELMLDSFNTIPQSFVERPIEIGRLEENIKLLIGKKGKLITLVSVIIFATSKALNKNKLFNAYRQKNQIMFYEKINIGVVISHNNNISIPVIKDAEKLSLGDITKELMRIRKSLLRRKIDINDVKGGTFTISALNHTKVSRFVPIVHPKQAAVLAIPEVKPILGLDTMGKLNESRILNIGLSFDHSFLDATQVSDFLNCVADEIKILTDELQ